LRLLHRIALHRVLGAHLRLCKQRSSAAASPEAELFAASYQGNEAAARAALDEHHANVECTDTVRSAAAPQPCACAAELSS
jgi:hypothetical protein